MGLNQTPQAHQDAHWAFSWFGAELLGAALATGLFWLLRRSESLGELGRLEFSGANSQLQLHPRSPSRRLKE